MSDVSELSAAKRALLEKYLRGEVSPQAVAAVSSATTQTKAVTTQPDVDAKTAIGEQRESVSVVQKGGNKRPFFFLHGQWEGNSFFCFPLARLLGADQPFYALEPYNFAGLPAPPSFEDIAAAHIKTMRSVQPEGPYLLGGWCNGALLAFEMARQLQAVGEKVDLLVLMDAMTLDYYPGLTVPYSFARRFGKLLRLSEATQLDLFLFLIRVVPMAIHLYRYVRRPHYRRSKPQPPAMGRKHYPGIYNWSALAHQPPNHYTGKVAFFWTHMQDYRKGWRRVEENNEVELYFLSGTHMSTISDHLDEMAGHLRACIKKAQEVTIPSGH